LLVESTNVCCDCCLGTTGLLQFQLQTGAVGHGEYFFLSFDNVTTTAADTSSSTTSGTAAASTTITTTITNSITEQKYITAEVTRQTTAAGDVPVRPLGQQTGFSTDVLRCEQYWHPGTEHAPFPYPPSQQNLTSCGYVAFCSFVH
jgi:hypothetical protein